MQLRFYVIQIILILSLAVNAENENMLFSNLSVKDGLSQNTVIRIFQDSKNYMWFCTRDGLNRYDGSYFKIYRHSIMNPNSISSSDVTCISENKDGSFWIGTHYGLNFFDPQNEKFTRYYHNPKKQNTISSSCIKHLLTDRNNNTWISTTHGLDLLENETGNIKNIYNNDAITWLIQRDNGDICYCSIKDGLFVYNPKSKLTINYPLPDRDFIYCLFEDSKKQLWAGMWSKSLKKLNPETRIFEQIDLKTNDGREFNSEQIGYIVEYKTGELMLATRKGILLYNTDRNLVTHIFNTKNSTLKDEKIITLYKDNANNVWAGSWNGGIDFYSPYSNNFRHLTPKTTEIPNSGAINALVEVNNDIWLATDFGILVYNKNNGTFSKKTIDIPSTSREVKMMYKDGDKLWLSFYAGGLHIYNLQTNKIEKSISEFRYGYVKAMSKDMDGNYWIAAGTNDPFLKLNTQNMKLQSSFPVKNTKSPFTPANVQDVFTDENYNVWIGTRSDGLYRYNYRTLELTHYVASVNKNSLNSNHVSVIFRDSKKRLWIGTFGGGVSLFDSKTHSFTSFKQSDGLLNDAICAITEDSKGALWISTLEGISKFNTEKKKFSNFNASNGYPIQETVNKASILLNNNYIAIGGMNSFVYFNPEKITENPLIPNVVITSFRIWKNNVSENENDTILNYSGEKIKLKYFQSAFSIYFAALNYVYPKNNHYSYMLEGFDSDWNTVKNERSATYTNIPPGKYVFRVKASNNDGVWNNDGVSMQIYISPPPWKTWWAYTLYAMIFIAIIAGFIYYILKKQILENDINIKQIEQRNQEMNHQMRVRLFTNFSHELRTPLTLIIGPLNEIIHKKDLPDWLISKLTLMLKNTERLLWLVNQLMDFRKLETGNMKLRVSNVDINMFINDVILSFKELANARNIELEYVNQIQKTDIWFDIILMEKVLFNLLSNAFKHTQSGGKILIEVKNNDTNSISTTTKTSKDELLISVSDSGDGIHEDELTKIFEPFYQAQNHDGTNIYGTGIGLNLCKSIVELHSGNIWAESSLNRGSVFRISLPYGNAHFSKDVTGDFHTRDFELPIISTPAFSNTDSDLTTTEENVKAKDNFTILVVEDNEDVRNYIRLLLTKDYRIVEAKDCLEGCKIALELVPDLIISDVMTPYMSGFELCQKLKNDEITNHIPIILLTALSGEDNIKDGLLSLADDYIVKPFNPEILKLRVNNLINIRRKIRQYFNKKSVFAKINTDLPTADEKFISKVFDYIKNNIDNPELRIDSFSKTIGMSRVQFYRKIKSITGKTPSTLIMEIRMNAASELIKKTDLNVNEIAFQVGFNDSSYFGKCFKIYFGVTPSEFKN